MTHESAESGSSQASRFASTVIVSLMSGTSLDGISAAVVRFGATLEAELLAFRQVPYDPVRRQRLAGALAGTTPDEYCQLNFELGDWLADAATAALADSGVPRDEVTAIASHGQTVWHRPPAGGRRGAGVVAAASRGRRFHQQRWASPSHSPRAGAATPRVSPFSDAW